MIDHQGLRELTSVEARSLLDLETKDRYILSEDCELAGRR